MRIRSGRASAVLFALLVASPATAMQATRADFIDQARNSFAGDTAVVQLLHAAMDPALGAPDSLWAVAGYDLAQALERLNAPQLAALWLRYIARNAPQYPATADYYPPSFMAEYDREAQAVAASPDLGDVSTSWRWPDGLDPAADGGIVVDAGGAPMTVSVESGGTIEAGGILGLPAGTYTLNATASGWEPVTITRNVLPGTTTEIRIEPIPLLPASAEAGIAPSVVSITYDNAGQQVCRSGYFASTDGYVLTSLSAVRDATSLSVTAAGGARTYTDVAVVASDADRDLAVLRLPDAAGAPAAVATDVSNGDWVWSVAASGCPGQETNRTRLASWNGEQSAATLALPLPGITAGSPLVDRGGFLIGIVTGPSNVLPDALTRDLIERARALIAVQVRPASGSFPWKWVGLGAAVAGVGVAVAGGGGGGGNDGGNNPPPPTTGGIIITFPN